MFRRIVIYSLLAIGIYYGYGVLHRATSAAPDLRQRASEDAGPLNPAVERRSQQEQAVEQSAGPPPADRQQE